VDSGQQPGANVCQAQLVISGRAACVSDSVNISEKNTAYNFFPIFFVIKHLVLWAMICEFSAIMLA
jgi:hypothetical protein